MSDTQRLNIVRMSECPPQHIEDEVVVEEPLEIRVNGDSLGVTMRTPGDDFDLAMGFMRTECLIRNAGEVGTMAYCPDEEHTDLQNVLNVILVNSQRQFETLRKSWVSSSCGLCGTSTVESIRRTLPVVSSPLAVHCELIADFPRRMREAQTNFNRTGGLHAACLFDSAGRLRLIREDLGRHNAVDKVIGAALRQDEVFDQSVLVVSGRLGFEIAQKAAVVGIPIIASVSAPSSLAVQLASQLGITAVGFVRGHSMNIYSHPQRILNGISEYPASKR